jgi:hypothetical protein
MQLRFQYWKSFGPMTTVLCLQPILEVISYLVPRYSSQEAINTLFNDQSVSTHTDGRVWRRYAFHESQSSIYNQAPSPHTFF